MGIRTGFLVIASLPFLVVLLGCGLTGAGGSGPGQEGVPAATQATEVPTLQPPLGQELADTPVRTLPAGEAAPTALPPLPQDYPSWTSNSADGVWGAKGYDNYYSGELTAYAMDGSAEWWVQYDSWEPFGWFEGILRPVGWESAGEGFLFALVPSIDGFVPFMSGAWVNRLDMRNGKVTVVLPPVENGFYSFALSPDGKALGYVAPGPLPKKVVIRILATDREMQAVLSERYIAAGGILWSPDGKYLVVGAATGESWEEIAYSLVRVDLGSMSQKLLVEDFPQGLQEIEWIDDHVVLLSDWEGNIHRLDIMDSTFRLVETATPYP